MSDIAWAIVAVVAFVLGVLACHAGIFGTA